MMRMVGRDDFLGHQAPMGNRSHRVAVIVQAIANIAFFTVHGTMGITHQPELGRTSAESNCFRMHPDDYVTSLSSSHSFDSDTQMVVASRPIGACIKVDRPRFIKSLPVAGAVAPPEIDGAPLSPQRTADAALYRIRIGRGGSSSLATAEASAIQGS